MSHQKQDDVFAPSSKLWIMSDLSKDVFERADAVMAGFPRAILGYAHTPLEPLNAIMSETGGKNLFIKRDDLTGLAFGGNKSRQLEYYFGEAIQKGADTVLITGAVQSNFVRTCAAAARKLGLNCEVQLEDRVRNMPAGQEQKGNALLDRILGVKIHRFPVGEEENAADDNLDKIADELRAQGAKPYAVHLGASHPPVGALGYIDCVREILEQTDASGVPLKSLVVPSGSASTHAGVVCGLRLYGSDAVVHGICVRRPADQQRARVLMRCRELAKMLGNPDLISDDDIVTNDGYYGEGYGIPTEGTMAAINTAARREAVLLDPVYSGKTFDGFLGLIKDGTVGNDGATVYIHTGGTPGLFAYAHLWDVPRSA